MSVLTLTRRATRPVQWILPVVVVVAVMSAVFFTKRPFASDWVNNLWLVWEQSLNIKSLGHPSYFVTSNLGVFQPEYVFYGGTFYTAAAYLTVLLGEHAIAAYIIMLGLAVAAAYAGCWWLAWQIGMRGWLAQAPAVLFVTSSYYVTNLYGRSDSPEAFATSMVPVVAAAGVWLVRAPRWRPLPVAVFVLAIVFLSGSHPETFIWGSTFLVALAVILVWSVADLRRLSWRRLVAVAGIAILGLCVNGWSLLPTALYSKRLLISSPESLGLSQVGYTAPGSLFSVARNAVTAPVITGNIQAQLPTLAIVWSIIVIVVLRGRASRSTLRLLVGLGFLLLAFAVFAMLQGSLSDVLPWPWINIQFPYRLVTYGTLAACGLVAVALSLLRATGNRVRRWASIGIAVVCLVSVGAAMKQIWSTPSFYFFARSQGLGAPGVAPASYYPGVTYTDISARAITPSVTHVEVGTPLKAASELDFPYVPLTSKVRLVVKVPTARATVATNIATGSYMVNLQGAVPAGRTAVAPGGGVLGHTDMVVRLTGKPGTLDTVTVSPRRSLVLQTGLWMSGIAAALVLLLVGLVWRSGRGDADGRLDRLLGAPIASAGDH